MQYGRSESRSHGTADSAFYPHVDLYPREIQLRILTGHSKNGRSNNSAVAVQLCMDEALHFSCLLTAAAIPISWPTSELR